MGMVGNLTDIAAHLAAAEIPNARPPDGRTPLFLAATSDDPAWELSLAFALTEAITAT